MTEKEKYLKAICDADKVLNELIPVQKDLHREIVLGGDSIPNVIVSKVQEADMQIKMLKEARELAQQMLFMKYKTVVLAKWQEVEP